MKPLLFKVLSGKKFGIAVGLLGGLALVGATACAFAGLLMLLWNVVGVAALGGATITFLTAFYGVGIIYTITALWNIIRIGIQSYMQKVQMQTAMNALSRLDAEMKKAQGQGEIPDILKHFHS